MKNFGLLFSLLLLCQNFLFAQLHVGSFEFEGRARNYEVYLPQNYQANMPVVFVFHGYTQSISIIKDMSKMHNVADTMGFITVYPKSASVSWNTGETPAYNWGVYDTTVNDVGFISALIDTIDKHFNVDLKRIYVCGFSSGGELAFKMIVELGHRFTAAASVSGVLNEAIGNKKPIHPVPIMQIHGTADPLQKYEDPYNNLWSVEETLNFWIENNECTSQADTVALPDIDQTDGSTVVKISYTNCSGDAKVVHYKVIGGGHSWPGRSNANKDFDASVEILNFFKEYTNPLLDSLAFGKSLEISHEFFPQKGDTLVVNAELTNPANHPVTAYANVRGIYTGFKDSVELFDDGLHNDGNSSDNIWGATKWLSGLGEDFFVVEGYAKDITEDLTLIIPTRGFFTTAGPLKLDSVSYSKGHYDYYNLKSFVINNGISLAINGATIRLYCNDPWLFAINSYDIKLPEIAPGVTVESISNIVISYIDSLFPGYFNLKARITVHGWVSWFDSLRISVTDTITNLKDEISNPINFKLIQNYPNPFNPSTKINYSIPKRSNVMIKVYDVLGNEIETLVNQEKSPGNYEVNFNAINLPSGVYFYELKAGSYVDTKKMILLK